MNKTKSLKVGLASVIVLGAGTVPCKFRITVANRDWEVEGFINIRTHEFTPEKVEIFSVSQFATDVAKMRLSEFREALQNMVTKNLTW